MEKETQNKIQELQVLEQNLQNFMLQKQTFQAQLSEIENALNELSKTKKQTYKIIGPIMVSSSKEELEADLNNKKDILNLRIKNLEKQENLLREKATKLQSEVIKNLEKKKK